MEPLVKVICLLLSATCFLVALVAPLVDCGRLARENNERTSVELSILPPGDVLEGATVTIRCRAPPGVKQPFDLLRLDRQVAGRMFEVTTNNLLRDVFKHTGRYQVITWDDDQGQIDLRIENIQGVDGGNIGCRLLSESHLKPSDVFTDLIVNVPPRSVEILYQYPSGDTYRASEAESLRLRQGVQTTITCRVTCNDTDFTPDVIVTSDGQDVTSRFMRNSTTIARADDGQSRQGFDQFKGHIYEYQLKVDPTGSDVASLVHGKNLTCLATLPHFSPVMASVRLEVAYKSQVQCDPEHGGLLGELNFEVVCTGRSHPRPHRVVWSWTQASSSDVIPPDGSSSSSDVVSVMGADERVEIFNGEINRQELRTVYSASQTDIGDSEYEFRFRISQLESRDFRSYDLEVTNEVGTAHASFRITQVLVSTSKRPSTPKTVVESIDDLRQPAESLISANGAQRAHVTSLCISLAATLIATTHLAHFSHSLAIRT